ncbi:anaerobic sulfatase maturase [Kiritimatiellaeota bacterium B1221]|nr:anaerobic sulfatase maturase [Kiritimatiellaeota bacterium B1221]
MTNPQPSLTQPSIPAFHVMTKPVGPICNLNCTYCFYLEKEKLFGETEQFRMADDVLENYIQQYIEQQSVPEVSFAWQGGEPTLLGVDYFRKIIELQKKHANGKKITNAIQTNGTLLNDKWGEFLAENDFLVGLSIDGPPDLHDAYRVDKRDKPSSHLVIRGLNILKKHKVEFNTLTVVSRKNSQKPAEVYRYLKEIGSGYIQFIPLVERDADSVAKNLGLDLSQPPELQKVERNRLVTEWSLVPEDYGQFLVDIYNHWVRHDVGKTFVQFFDVALGNWMGMSGALCVFSPTCGTAMALEHNGDLYSCDHYVYPKYKLGNIMNQSIKSMVESKEQRQFGQDKLSKLPKYCRDCSVRFACHGECPKHRFMKTPDGDPGLNYLCPGYKRIFNHMKPTMDIMCQLLRSQRPASDVMQVVAQQPDLAPMAPPKRNAPCPCGSGRKFKACCGR